MESFSILGNIPAVETISTVVEEVSVVEGLKFMVIGMSVVFAFLVIMVILMNFSSTIITKFFPDKPEVVMSGTVAGNKSKIAAVIAIAKAQANK